MIYRREFASRTLEGSIGKQRPALETWMFRLNRLTDYAVVVMSQMALRPEQTNSAHDIAAETGVPLPTVSKLLGTLARAGLMTSQRGAMGGYALSRAADQITMAEIIQALEGPIALTACVEGAESNCDVESLCPMRGNWNRVNTAIHTALSSVTLADMSIAMPMFGVPAPDERQGEHEQEARRGSA